MRAFLLFFLGLPVLGQTWTLGSSSDPCIGGAALTIAGTTSTIRWSNGFPASQPGAVPDFTCSFTPVSGPPPAIASQQWQVTVTFLEPCAAAGACAGGQITGPGQRVENVLVNDSPVAFGFDTFTAAATNAVSASRTALAYTVGGNILVRVQTVTRAAVLASVTILPVTPISAGRGISISNQSIGIDPAVVPQLGGANTWTGANDFSAASLFKLPASSPTIARQICVGSGGTVPAAWDCTGIEMYTVTAGGIVTQYVATPAPPSVLALPQCPATAGACWQPRAVGQ